MVKSSANQLLPHSYAKKNSKVPLPFNCNKKKSPSQANELLLHTAAAIVEVKIQGKKGKFNMEKKIYTSPANEFSLHTEGAIRKKNYVSKTNDFLLYRRRNGGKIQNVKK